MKQYHLTKKFVKFFIIADLIMFSVAFVNLVNIKNHTLKPKAEETDSCSTYNVKFSPEPSGAISTDLNSPIALGIMIDTTQDPDYVTEYDYKLILRDNKTNNETSFQNVSAADIANGVKPDTYTETEGTLNSYSPIRAFGDLYLPAAGSYSYKLRYTAGECESRETPWYGITVTKGQGNASISIPAERVGKGETVAVNYTINDNNGGSFLVYINKGGTDCPASSQEDTCWSKYAQGKIDKNTYTGFFGWNTGLSELGGHQIKLKVFGTSGTGSNNPMTASATTTIYICDPDLLAAGQCVGDGSDPGDGNGSSSNGIIQVEENKFNKTLKSLFGGKDMTQIGLDDLFSPDKEDSILSNARKIALDLAGVFAIIMILWSSIIYATSYGEESKAEMAKKTLTWSVIGLIVIIFSQTIFTLIEYYL